MRRFLFIICIVCTSTAYAYDFEVDGIFYNILEGELWDHENPVVEVTYEKKGTRKTLPTETYVDHVVIPAYVTWERTEYQVIGIGYSAFSWCDLSSITLPEGLEYIDDAAFASSGLYGHVTLPNTLTYIGTAAFSACGLMGSIVIPNSVTYMGDMTFEGCEMLKYAVLSANQKSVPREAFARCTLLQYVVMPEGIESIEDEAFYECQSIKLSNLPQSLKRIGNRALAYASISGVFLPYNVTEMGVRVFENCTSLTYACIPKQITKLPEYTFFNCWVLKHVTIPKNIREIGDYAFYMPRYIEYGDHQIWWGSALETVYIMGDVDSIGQYAFGRSDKSSLEDVYCYSSVVPKADSTTFTYDHKGQPILDGDVTSVYDATLHVPASLIHEYQNTYPWSLFPRIVALTDNIRPQAEPQQFANYKMSELKGFHVDATYYYLYNTQTKSFFCYDNNKWDGIDTKWNPTAHLGAPATKIFFLRYPQHIFDGSVQICCPYMDSYEENYYPVQMEGVDNNIFMVKDMGGGVYRIGLSEHNRDFKRSLYPDCYMGFDQYEGASSVGQLDYMLEPGKEPEGHTYCVDWKLVSPAEYNKIADQLYTCSSGAYLKQLIDSTAIHHPRININKMETAYFDTSLSGVQLDSVRNVLLTAVSLSEYMNELKQTYPSIDLSDAMKLLSRSDFTLPEIETVRKQLDMAVIRTDVLAVIGGATEKHPKSVTELMQNPSFEKANGWIGWKQTYSYRQSYDMSGINTRDTQRGKDAFLSIYDEVLARNNYASTCYPSLRAALGNGETYSTLIGLPNGKYVLECDAAATNEKDIITPELMTGVYLFVSSSGFETLTPIMTDRLVPRHFSNEFYISSGDTIYFGIKTLNTTASHYAMDNFTLTYYGETDREAYHGTLMSRLSTFNRLYPDLEQLYADPLLKQDFDETYKENDIIVGDYIAEKYSTAMKAVEQKAAALNRSVSNYINAALLCQYCEREREYYEGTEYTELADQLGDLEMCLESGYQDCNLDELLMESYRLTIGEVYDYIQQLITETTGIEENVKIEKLKNASIYNLQGQRIETLQKGLNIVDGKKVWVR